MAVTISNTAAIGTSSIAAQSAKLNDVSFNQYKSKATSVGITSFDSYMKTDAEGNITGVDVAKLNADIKEAEKNQKKIEEQQAEFDSFVFTTKGQVKEDELKSEVNQNKYDIEDGYGDLISLYNKAFKAADKVKDVDIFDKITSLEELKAQKNKLLGSTSSDTQVFEGAANFLNSIQKTTTKISNFITSLNSKENEESIFEVNTEIKKKNALEDVDKKSGGLTDNPFFKSAFNTSDIEE